MTIDEQHVARLLPDTREMLTKSAEEKINYIFQDRWIPYPEADHILNKLDLMLSMPKKIRHPSMLIAGDSGCGKTSLVRHFRDSHPLTDGMNEPACPVFYLESCPPEPDEGRLYENILTALMVPFRYSDKPAMKLNLVAYHFKLIGTKMLILDEIGNSLSGSAVKQRVFLNAIKNLHNAMHGPIVLVGTKEAHYVTDSDKQIGNRFKKEPLSRWKYGNDFQQFLARLELTLPLSRASLLAAPDLSKLIFDRAGSGCIGDFIELVGMAAVMAINNGSKRVTAEEIKGCDFTPSSKRQPDP